MVRVNTIKAMFPNVKIQLLEYKRMEIMFFSEMNFVLIEETTIVQSLHACSDDMCLFVDTD